MLLIDQNIAGQCLAEVASMWLTVCCLLSAVVA